MTVRPWPPTRWNTLYQPQNGWAEQEPSDWWRAVQETVQAVLHKSGVASADVAGVGISGQMHGLVMLDERGEVLHRSILWCDGRTGEECREITETVGAEKLIAITANPALAGFTAGKILWVRKHLPEVYKACRHILLPKDYIRYCLTGQFATEVSDASGMNLLDVPRRQWSDEILNKLDIDPALLGRMYESVDVTGTVTAEAAALTGLSRVRPWWAARATTPPRLWAPVLSATERPLRRWAPPAWSLPMRTAFPSTRRAAYTPSAPPFPASGR